MAFSRADLERIVFQEYPDTERWADGVARETRQILAYELKQRDQARLLLSGGTTPAPTYQALAESHLDWSRVEVGLVDERWLSPQDRDSNARLVREKLLAPIAMRNDGEARFEPLVRVGTSLAESVHAANLHANHAAPPCLAVLGMGGDGHIASLFPGSANLGKALASKQPYAGLDASGCPGAGQWPLRITLTPAGLAQVKNRLLLIRGHEKRALLQRALAGDDVQELPIRLAISAPGTRLRVHWCP